jgi:transcriptional regulator with XRE-family HTH domain
MANKKIVKHHVPMRSGLTLPPVVVVALHLFQKDQLHQRDAYIYALRMKGWTLESVGQALDLSRERIRQLESKAKPLDVIAILSNPGSYPVPEVPTRIVEEEVVVYAEPSPETLARLLELKPIAEKVRSFSPTGREAAEEYTRLLNYARTVEGVPLYRLAKRLGVTHGALHFRLVRYGYLPTSGKSRAYQKIIDKNRFSNE